MHIGLSMFPTEYAIEPHHLAIEAEARAFESLWFPEHTHIPASRRTPYPGGGDLPREYWHTFDPFGALCAAAAVTRTIKLATGICLLIERDTIVTAKEAATVDWLSGGRFLFGIGGGWNVEEMENHGTGFKTRFKKLKEQVLAIREIWTKEAPEFHGEMVRFDPIWCHPKPVQKPGPPVILGGTSTHAMDRAIDYGDGWMPIDGGVGPDALGPMLAEFDSAPRRPWPRLREHDAHDLRRSPASGGSLAVPRPRGRSRRAHHPARSSRAGAPQARSPGAARPPLTTSRKAVESAPLLVPCCARPVTSDGRVPSSAAASHAAGLNLADGGLDEIHRGPAVASLVGERPVERVPRRVEAAQRSLHLWLTIAGPGGAK